MPKSKETETLIDEQFQNLVSLSTIKYDPEERIQSSIYSDTFNLTLMAAKTIQSSRLVGYVYKDPFKILFDNYSKDTKTYLFLLLEELSSIFMAIQDINKKYQKISSLSEYLITVSKNIVNEFNTRFSANFVYRGTSLFEDETVEWHRTLFEESRMIFAVVISFYRSLDDNHDVLVAICECLTDILVLTKDSNLDENNLSQR